eukprot:6411973-Prymnesium_polylepis.1
MARFDMDGSGTIDAGELLGVLQAVLPGADASKEDVRFLTEHCDEVRLRRPFAGLLLSNFQHPLRIAAAEP